MPSTTSSWARSTACSICLGPSAWPCQCSQALTELYQLLDKLNEQLGLAKNELFVANVGGHPFLLPGQCTHFSLRARPGHIELRQEGSALCRLALAAV